MQQTAPQTGFDAQDKADRAATNAISLVMRVPAPLKPIADQVIRSASSVSANIAEGRGRSGRDRHDERTLKGPLTGACRVRSCAGMASRSRRAFRTTTIPGNPREAR